MSWVVLASTEGESDMMMVRMSGIVNQPVVTTILQSIQTLSVLMINMKYLKVF
jgi:hypothetical protein